MNEKLQTFAREDLKRNLAKCTAGERIMFARMYWSPTHIINISKIVTDIHPDDIDAILLTIEPANLSWAMEQVQRTLDKK